MEELTKIIIVKENAEVITFFAPLHSPNEFLFSKELLLGDKNKAIENYVNENEHLALTHDTDLAPVDAGLTVIDFKNKSLLALNHVIQPGKINPFQFKEKIIMPYYEYHDEKEINKYNHYFKHDIVKFLSYPTGQEHSAHELFGTQNSLEIIELIDNKNKQTRMSSTGLIKNYHDKSFPMHLLIPSVLNLTIKQFKPDELDNFFIALNQNIVLSNIDINAWYDFLDTINQEESKLKIQNYLSIVAEQTYLEKSIEKNQSNTNKIKL